jgi:acetylglutamate kinase
VDNADAILRFMASIGRRSEAEFYLSLFRAERKESFAALVVESGVFRHALEALLLDLRFLHELELSPVVVVGLYHPTGAARDARRLSRKLAAAGVGATAHDIGAADVAAAVRSQARAGGVPIVAFAAESGEVGERFAATGGLVAALEVRKLIFLERRGGLRPRGADGELPVINLMTDFAPLATRRQLPGKQIYLLEQARRLLCEQVSHRMLIAVTSPLNLLRELFTVKGAGTLIKRGSAVNRFASYAELDVTRLGALLASSFGRPLPEDFFARPAERIYVEEAYRGAAIVRAAPPAAYLTKFAVDREQQGEGLGRDLWRLVCEDYPALFWRARPNNPIAPWYTAECDGMYRAGEWQVFWRGLAPAAVPAAIEYALAQPRDFQAPHE